MSTEADRLLNASMSPYRESGEYAGPKWEYIIEDVDKGVKLSYDRALLARRGSEGWELVSALCNFEGQFFYVFKRQAR